MNRFFLWRLIVIFLLLFNGCTFKKNVIHYEVDNLEKLRQELTTVIERPEFFNAHWGVAIQSLKTGENFYLKNENKNFVPASNMKLFTTAVALLKLTPDFCYCTKIYKNGDVSDEDLLNGDLIIKGCGDPSITGRYHSGKINSVFETWADSLYEKGIRAINGNIIGDDNLFEDEIMGEGWSWDYQSDWYAAQISSLSFNDNCIDIIFMPGDSLGAKAKYRLEPSTNYIQIINNVITVDDGLAQEIYFNRKRGTNCIEISGSISIKSKEKRDWFSIENPTLFTVTIFKQILEKRGIIVSGVAKDIDDYPDYSYQEEHELIRYYSPPLWQIVNTINKDSQNLYAELLLRTLGVKFQKKGDAQHGIKEIKETLSTMGINPANFNMVDGSGLSRLNLATPLQFLTLLQYMRNSSVSDYYYNSLSTAGVNGSLRHRMKYSRANGKVKAKSGYLGKVVSLSGYLMTADKEEIAFSIITNNYTAPTSMAHELQDLICQRLTNFKRYR